MCRVLYLKVYLYFFLFKTSLVFGTHFLIRFFNDWSCYNVLWLIFHAIQEGNGWTVFYTLFCTGFIRWARTILHMLFVKIFRCTKFEISFNTEGSYFVLVSAIVKLNYFRIWIWHRISIFLFLVILVYSCFEWDESIIHVTWVQSTLICNIYMIFFLHDLFSLFFFLLLQTLYSYDYYLCCI